MNYLDVEKMEAFIQSANIRQISKIWVNTENIVCTWGMYTLEGCFRAIDIYIPEINEFIDIAKVQSKAYKNREERKGIKPDRIKPQTYDYSPLGFKLEGVEDVFPEIIIVKNKFRKAFMTVPSGVEKAEAWLYPSALNAGADSDVEALIYFKSQGESFVSSNDLSETWRKAICSDVERGYIYNKDAKIIEKAKKKDISLVELADLFEHSIMHPCFLSARDEEEDFIYSTFFRAMEWFQLNEYEPWANIYAQEISTLYQGGVDQGYSLLPLFYYCRSDLLLSKASKFGLEALLYGLCVGNIDSSKPWKQYWDEPDKAKRDATYVDYVPTASVIAFAWQRINPTNINKEVLDQALLLLFQTQLVSGAWPLTSDDDKGSIFSTCLAMTALSVTKPTGYQRYVDRSKEWLLSQQNEVGCWYIQGAPAIMINILCLEAIRLAEGSKHVTYLVKDYQIDTSLFTTSIRKQTDKFIIFCEGNSGSMKNSNFDEKCYTKIFSLEFPNSVFCSVGSCKDIESDDKLLFETIKKVNPYHIIIKLIDRDDRSLEEIEVLKLQGITVLSLRELESYLLEDEIIEKLCMVCDKLEKADEIKVIKADALRQSITRGNPTDDLKSAAGLFFTETKKALGLIQCGNDTVSFLRDTMAPLLTEETNTYKLLRKDIFGI
ncbi:hypothetical protein U6B65_05650 [Oscillospiraceae bacterium MB08-C2-2]|nr:hypothetical protein U6B65_05650 [Oscillospiraceae bacterium MB08-C2-2]